MKRWINVLWAVAATVAVVVSESAQGGVLPGMTVTATSPAQIGSLSAVTNEATLYRFPTVPPGEYRLSYGLA